MCAFFYAAGDAKVSNQYGVFLILSSKIPETIKLLVHISTGVICSSVMCEALAPVVICMSSFADSHHYRYS